MREVLEPRAEGEKRPSVAVPRRQNSASVVLLTRVAVKSRGRSCDRMARFCGRETASDDWPRLICGPGPEGAADHHQLPQMIRIVVRHQQRLAEDRLAG